MEKKKNNKEWIYILVAIIIFCVGGLIHDWWNNDTENNTVENSDCKKYDNYQEACRAGDFVSAYKIIEISKGTEADKDYVFNAEMLYLASQNTEEASNRILYLLAEYQIPGTPTSPGAEYKGEAYDEVKKYIEGISRYNNRCNSVLDMAIAQGNEKLARGVVALFKQNVDIGIEWTNIKDITISKNGTNSTDIDIAKKKLEEAIKTGAFE